MRRVALSAADLAPDPSDGARRGRSLSLCLTFLTLAWMILLVSVLKPWVKSSPILTRIYIDIQNIWRRRFQMNLLRHYTKTEV